MSDELLDNYIDREAFRGDTDFAVTELGRIVELQDKLNGFKLQLQGAQTLREVSAAAEGGAKSTDLLGRSVERLKFAISDENIQLQANNALISNANREAKALGKEQAGLSTEYDKQAKRMADVSRQLKGLVAAGQENTEQFRELKQEFDSLNTTIRKADATVGDFRRNVGNYEGSAKIIVDALEKEKIKLQSLTGSYNTFNGEVQKSRNVILGFAGDVSKSGEIKKLEENISSAGVEMRKLEGDMENSRKVIEGFQRVAAQPGFLKLAGGVSDANMELKAMTKALIDLERQGLGDSEAAKELRKSLAQLTDEIGDAKAEIKALSSDTRQFDLFAGSVTFAADAMQTLAGAAVLAGASEEEAAESTRTLVAIQSIANGVKGIANELTTRGTAANKLYAFTQKQISTAMDTTVGAATRLRAALIGIGIGALIVAIGYLVTNFNKVKEALGFVNKAQENFNDTLEAYADGAKGAIEQTNKVGVAFQQAKEGVISKDEALKVYNETLGDSFGKAKTLQEAEDLYNAKAGAYIEAMALRAQANALFAKSAEEMAKGLTAANEDQVTIWDKFKQSLTRESFFTGQTPEQLARIQAQKVKEIQEKSAADSRAIQEKGYELAKRAEQLAKTNKIDLDPDKAKTASTAKKKDTSVEDKLKADLEAEKRNAAAIRALNLERANETIRINQSIVDAENSNLRDRIGALDVISTERKKIAAIEFADAIADEEKIENGKRVVIAKSQDEIALAREQFHNKVRAIDEQLLKGQNEAQKIARDKALKDLADHQEKEIALLVAGKEKKQAANDVDYSADIIGLNDRYNKGKLSQDQYNKELEKINYDYHVKQLEAEIAFTKQFLDVMSARGVDVSKEKSRLAQLEMELSNATRNQVLKNEEEKRAAVLETLDKIQQSYQVVADIVSGVLNASATQQKNKIQEEIDAIEKKKEAELLANDARLQSEEERAAAAININARAQAQREQLERRQKEIDRQKAQAEKALAIFSIALSTAKNVAAATTPWGKIFAAISGAAQMAIAIATPIPKFFKGKKANQPYEGPAMVNDHPDGRTMEVIERADGSIEMPSERNAVINIGARDVIHPDRNAWVNAAINAAFRDTSSMIRVAPTTNGSEPISGEIKRMTRQVVSAIKNQPGLNLEAKDGGLVALWKFGANQIKYVDQNCNF